MGHFKRYLALFIALLCCWSAMVCTAEGMTIADIVGDSEKPTLRQLCINTSADYNTYPTAIVLEEATGYHVEYDMLPSDGANEKLNMIMAAHEDYDIIVAGNTDMVVSYAKAGLLLDLTDYLQYTPKLDAAINEYERETFSVDGRLYAIGMQSPAFGGRGQTQNTVFIRQDYLEDLGMEKPQTIDDFVDMLRAFKDYDNGTETATIPLTLTNGNIFLDCVVGAFGIPNVWNEVNGELVNRAADPRILDYLQFMKGLYEEGLIDVDYPANKSANVYEKFSTGVAASAYLSCYNYSKFGDSMKELQPDSVITYMDPLVGPDGSVGYGISAGGMDRIAFIPAWCKNVDHVFNYMELKLEPETFINVTIGVEGEHYTVDENGVRWPILPKFTDERANSVNYYTGRPAEEYADYWMLRVKKRADIWEAWSYMNLEEPFASSIVISYTGYAPNFDSNINTGTLDSMLNDMCLKIMAGDSTCEEYDAFLEQWFAEGGQALTADYNNWWATFEK